MWFWRLINIYVIEMQSQSKHPKKQKVWYTEAPQTFLLWPLIPELNHHIPLCPVMSCIILTAPLNDHYLKSVSQTRFQFFLARIPWSAIFLGNWRLLEKIFKRFRIPPQSSSVSKNSSIFEKDLSSIIQTDSIRKVWAYWGWIYYLRFQRK